MTSTLVDRPGPGDTRSGGAGLGERGRLGVSDGAACSAPRRACVRRCDPCPFGKDPHAALRASVVRRLSGSRTSPVAVSGTDILALVEEVRMTHKAGGSSPRPLIRFKPALT